jgi:diphthamide synthase (EF-2-diphthine--ammonia ligase)
MEDVLISWSGGKDSCLALYELQRAGTHRAAALLTTVTKDYDRVQMHGVRRVLFERLAERLGLPLRQVLIPKGASNEEYERATAEAFAEYRGRGIDAVVFGDLFLEDVRAYREQFLARHGMRGLYPALMPHTGHGLHQFRRVDRLTQVGVEACLKRAVAVVVHSEASDSHHRDRDIFGECPEQPRQLIPVYPGHADI